jgi:hypothetical protein
MDRETGSYYSNLAMFAFIFAVFLGLTIWMAYDALVVQKNFFGLFVGRYGSAFLTSAAIIPVVVIGRGILTKRITIGPGQQFVTASPADPDKKYLFGVPVGYVNWYIALFLGFFLIGATYSVTRSLPLTLVMAGSVLVFCAIAHFLTHGAWGFLFFLMVGIYLFPMTILAGYILWPVYAPDQFLPRIIARPFSAFFAIVVMMIPVLAVVRAKLVRRSLPGDR